MIELSLHLGELAFELSMYPAVPVGLALIISLNTSWLAWMHVRSRAPDAS